MNLAVPVCVRTEEVTLMQKWVVRDWDCGDGASPSAWCQGMPEICDDSICQYVGFVGCDLDCVNRTVPEGGDDYPFGTLLLRMIGLIRRRSRL